MKPDGFIREVEEELQRDRMMALWKRYGAFVIAAAAAVIIGTAGSVGWSAWQQSQRQAEAQRFTDARSLLQDGLPEEAAAAFSGLADDSSTGFAVLARLAEAQALREAGDADGATAVLQTLADDSSTDPTFRELAGVLVASREVGTGGGADLTAQLQALAASGAPWRYTARELLAVAQMEAGDTESARRTLGELIDDAGTPINLRRRAGELLESLGGPIAEEAAQ